jgi:hypothetical protein
MRGFGRSSTLAEKLPCPYSKQVCASAPKDFSLWTSVHPKPQGNTFVSERLCAGPESFPFASYRLPKTAKDSFLHYENERKNEVCKMGGGKYNWVQEH